MVVCHSSGPNPGPARSLVIAAGGGRDLAWPHQRVAAELLARSGGRPVQRLFHGGARGADAAIARAAHQLGWSAIALPAAWERHGRAAGPIRNRELLQLAIAEALAHSSLLATTSVLVLAFPGGPGTASLVQQARRMASRSPWWRSAHPPVSGPCLLYPPAREAFRALGRHPIHSPHTAMPVLSPAPIDLSSSREAAPPEPTGPVCSLQRSGSLWQLGIEAQELTTAIGQLAEQLEADDEDSRAQALAKLEAALLAEEGNKAALAAKADATCWVIEHLRGQVAYRQQQAKRLTELSRSDTGRADALEESLVLVLTRWQPSATRFSFANHELTSRKSQAVEINDEEALAPEWLAITTTSKPDKAAIKEAIKAGHLIHGAQLISRRSWRIH